MTLRTTAAFTAHAPFLSASTSRHTCAFLSSCVTYRPSSFSTPSSLRLLSTPSTFTMSTSPSPQSTTTPTSDQQQEQTSFRLPDTFTTPPDMTVLGPSIALRQPSALRRFLARVRLAVRLRGRVPSGSILTMELNGTLPETPPTPRFSLSASSSSSSSPRLQTVLYALRAAALDPRIAHLHVRLGTLACGWSKVTEIRRHLQYFCSAGKSVSMYMEAGGPKEFFIAAGYATFVPPEGVLSLRGFATSASFVRGVLDNIGIDPQVERIGEYKSAGDQLSRTTMSDAQRETLQEILNDVEDTFKNGVCQALNMQRSLLDDFVNDSPWSMQRYVDAGLITATCYESELYDALKLRFAKRSLFGTMPNEKDILSSPLRAIPLHKYTRNKKLLRLFGQTGRKRIAVIRALGAITPGKSGSSPVLGTTAGSDTLIGLLRRARDDKRIDGVLLRVDSPGGAALSSDLVWHELRSLRSIKPLVATQGDVAASGGYYLSMGAHSIVSERLTITGSIGVVTAKPSLQKLYQRLGYTKENVSTGGKFSELLVDNRPFSDAELVYFKEGARAAYDSFVNKAALSRNMGRSDMDAVAQGRVWTGKAANERGLVDAIGGIDVAIDILKKQLNVPIDQHVTLDEFTPPMSFAQRLGLAGATTNTANTVVSMIESGTPLALADVDAAGATNDGLAPVARAVADFALAKIGRSVQAAGLGMGQGDLRAVFERVFVTLLSK